MVKILRRHAIQQFRQNPRFYALYDGSYLLLSLGAAALMLATGFRPIFGGPRPSWLAVAPVLLFGLIWAHLVVHTCTHGALPRSINRLVGEILGLIVIVRFASWEIVHLRHHRYSDERLRDPHPNFRSFWTTVLNTVLQVEKQLFQEYFDVWGDTPETRRSERRRAWISYGTNVALLAAWTLLVGPWFMVLVFVPANALAGLFVIHFNWSTHNGERAETDADFRPVNLNHGYYAWGNKLFAGIYMHANHHHRPHAFNPARVKEAPWAVLPGPSEPNPLGDTQ